MVWRRRMIAVAAAAVWLSPAAVAQSQQVADLHVGKLLVAPRKAPDPSFAEAVILLAQMDETGTLGLMINRRTNVPLSRVLDLKPASKRTDPVYVGGPVELGAVMALLRSATAPGKAPAVMPGMYLVSTRQVFEKALSDGTGPGKLHVYLGYCGWGEGQLEDEVKQGGWFIFRGDADQVFDSDPGSLWSRLIEQTERRFAGAGHSAMAAPRAR